MPSRQHAPLVLIGPGEAARALPPVSLQHGRGLGGYDEAWVRDLVFAHPEAVPVGEIDPAFGPLVPVCTELDTRVAGFADALFLNPLGMPTLVECKLWRNPEARREVVGQILDYARALRRWTYTDLQREVARARRQQGFDLLEFMRDTAGLPDLDQAAFVDSVTRNLAQGRFLLLVLGDGIREGVEAIADYLQGTTGLHFTFALVEAQVFDLGDGRRIVQPRILARTLVVNRTVVNLLNPGLTLVEPAEQITDSHAETRTGPSERELWMAQFWADMLAGLHLDDAEQPTPKVYPSSRIEFMMPARSSMWLSCYSSLKERGIGVFLGSSKTSALAMEIGRRLEQDRDAITDEIGLPLKWSRTSDGKVQVAASLAVPDLQGSTTREDQIAWFRTTINAFVNALRPRIAALADELTSGAGGVA